MVKIALMIHLILIIKINQIKQDKQSLVKKNFI